MSQGSGPGRNGGTGRPWASRLRARARFLWLPRPDPARSLPNNRPSPDDSVPLSTRRVETLMPDGQSVRCGTIMRGCGGAMALIELRNLGRTYDLGEVQVHALRSVTLDIRAGEFLALIGPSGSGKSTLMNTVGCLDRPTTGSYHLDGVDVGRLGVDALARLRNRQIGFVFQNFNLLPRTTALENVEVPMLYDPGTTRRARHRRAKELLAPVGLGDRLGPKPNQPARGPQPRGATAPPPPNPPPIP